MKKRQFQLVAALLLSAGGFGGCSGSGSNVNIGDTSAVGAKLSDYAASWDGYAQAYSFWPGGSDRVRLTIDAEGNGNLRVGDAALLPAPTDPNSFTPSNIAELPDWSNLVEGGLYPTHLAEVQVGRIQFGINPWDLEAAWCTLQTPVHVASGNGFDVPDGGPHIDYECTSDSATPSNCSYTGADGQTHSFLCAKDALCGNAACLCTESSCAGRGYPDASSAHQYPDQFDAALDATGRTLTGTLNLDGNRITVVMQRQ